MRQILTALGLVLTVGLIIAWATYAAGSLALGGAFQAQASTQAMPVGSTQKDQGGSHGTPVVVELFTSEGCSSCPPADALLARIARTQPVSGADAIVLEEHVNYWDRLGWKDPFSSGDVTERQAQYGESFGGHQVYTPQMVVDGRAEFVGSDERKALQAIGSAGSTPKPAVRLAWQDDQLLSVRIESLPNADPTDTPRLVLAITESALQSDVKRGENAGRSLRHDGVVRSLADVGRVNGTVNFSSTVRVRTSSDWSRSKLRAVLFVQERKSRRILAAAVIAFPS